MTLRSTLLLPSLLGSLLLAGCVNDLLFKKQDGDSGASDNGGDSGDSGDSGGGDSGGGDSGGGDSGGGDSGDSGGGTDADHDGYTVEDGDCDDGDATAYPGAREECDGVDNDCDGRADEEAPAWYRDADNDGYGAGTAVRDCDQPDGYVADDGDCNDNNRNIHPGADEVCDGADNDCDGSIDNDAIDAEVGFDDVDGDGFGDPATEDLRCDGVDNGLDCNDRDATEPQAVDGSSSAGRPDGTITRPWNLIQDGIDAADECVVVAAGRYTENIDFTGKDILVMSIDGARSTVIDGDASGPAARFDSGEGIGAELRGFTLTNGSGNYETTSSSRSCGSSTTCTDYYYTWCGGGLYVDGSTPILTELVITANSLTTPSDSTSGNNTYTYYSFGGGVCVRNAAVRLNRVEITENFAKDGGGAYVESGGRLTLVQSSLIANAATSGAAIEVDGGALVLENALLAWNEASFTGGGLFASDASVTITNVTIGESQAGTAGGGMNLDGTTSATVVNSIVYGADSGVGVLVGSSATFRGSYNDVYGNTDGAYSGITNPTGTNGNLAVNPGFVSVTDDGNPRNDDWHLGTSSSCSNVGDPSASYNDADGSRNDMGAYGGPYGGW